MLLIPCDAEIVREAAPETPHLLDEREEALQDERVAPQNHHVSGIEREFLVHLEVFHGHAPSRDPLGSMQRLYTVVRCCDSSEAWSRSILYMP